MPDIKFPRITPSLLAEYRERPDKFIEEQTVVRNAHDGGRTWIRPELTKLQRKVVLDVLTTKLPGSDDEMLYTTMLLSWARKMGKTLLASLMWVYKCCCFRNELVLLVSNTKTAATELAFTAALEVFTRNVALKEQFGVVPVKGIIKINGTGSEIRAVSRGPGAQAGADWTVCHVDELWAFEGKQMKEFYRTVTTPSPTRRSPLLCVTSYAPIKDRSTMLESLIKRALKKEPRLYASIVSGVDRIVATCPWITKKFLAQMKRTQTPHQFKRVFLNKITADTEDADYSMFSRGQVNDVTDMGWSRQLVKPADAIGVTVLGIDFGAKHDAAVVSALSRMKDRSIALLDMVAKHGTKKNPLNGDWVVDTVLDMVGRFGHVKIMLDPTGITDQVATLRNKGFDVIELSHKGPHITDALWRAIAGKRLRLYQDAGMVETFDGRQYCLNDELLALMIDNDTRKMWHRGEADETGRQYDDRATTLGLALQAPELDLANTAAIRGAVVGTLVSSQPLEGKGQRTFAQPSIQGRKIFPGAVFQPTLITPGVGGKFGFRRF